MLSLSSSIFTVAQVLTSLIHDRMEQSNLDILSGEQISLMDIRHAMNCAQ